MLCLRLRPTCSWANRLSGMCDTFESLHVHTWCARPDAVTVQLDPAMSLGLNLDDFLGVSVRALSLSAFWSRDVSQHCISSGLAGHFGCTG